MNGHFSADELSLLFVVLYAAFVVRQAVVGREQTHNEVDFYVGGRRLGGIALGFSFFATFASTNSYVGLAGQSYVVGPAWLLLAGVLLLFVFISWRWIAPRLRIQSEELSALTIPESLGKRYTSNTLRVATAVIVVAASVFYMTAIFRGIGLTIDAFWHTGYEAAVAIVLVLVVVYTAAGGYISVVRTDILQGAVMIVASMLLFWAVVDRAGGLAKLAPAFTQVPAPFAANQPTLGIIVGMMFALSIKIVVEPRLLSRFYGLRDLAAVRTGMVTSMSALFVVLILLMPIGLLGRILFPDGSVDPDTIVPTIIASEGWVHPAVAAFLFLALLAASMSSIDSVLLVAATTFHRDIVRLTRGTSELKHTVRQTRILTIIIGIVTALIAIRPPGGIIALTSFSGALYSACLMAPMLFGLYGRKRSQRAALASLGIGAASLLILTVAPVSDALHPIFLATALSLLAFVLVSAIPART